MQNVAQSWLVWELTRSPVAIGVVAFFDSMPRLLVGAFGGAIADRFDRRQVLLITQTLAMVQAIIYWLAVWFGVIAFWHIVGLSFFLGIVNTINQTARQSLVNSLVPRDELLNAIGLQSSVFNFSKILGPSAGGLIIGFIGIADCFLVNALSFLALIYNLHLMELPAWEKRAASQSIWVDIKEGFAYVRGSRRIFNIISISYVMATFGAPYNRFVPIFATIYCTWARRDSAFSCPPPALVPPWRHCSWLPLKKCVSAFDGSALLSLGLLFLSFYSHSRILSCCPLRFSPWSAFAKSRSGLYPIPRFRWKRRPTCWAVC
jgi:MFS family permease